MGQIVIRNQKPIYCALQAIREGGSLTNVIPNEGDIWLVSPDTEQPNGSGIYTWYIVGDGETRTEELPLNRITPLAYLNTNNSVSLSPVPKEVVSDIVDLHRISKTGRYSDLLGKPEIDVTPTLDSENLITSGAVYHALGDIQRALDAILNGEEEEEPETISFNVDFFEDDEEGQYSAIAGMTWEAWIASEYNREFQVEGTLIRSNNGGYMQYDTTGSRPVYKHESIIASKLYYVGSIEEKEEPEPEEE